MLSLFFEGLLSTMSFRTGTSPSFRIDASEITDQSGESITIRNGEMWKARDNFFTHIVCDGPVTATLKTTDGFSLTNTFKKVRIIAGVIYGDVSYLAMLDNANKWRDHRTGKTGVSIILTEARTERFQDV